MLTQLETAPIVTTIIEEELQDEDPIEAHIVVKDEKMSASAKVTEALVNGTMLTALCGKKWVPSRTPQNHPVCPKCVEIFKFDLQFNS